jgi:pimeloyl-ACP methyl ester carboxylesterase
LEGKRWLAVAKGNYGMKSSEFSSEVDGLRLHGLQRGSGPPLVLIHGLLGGSFCWRFSLPALSEHYSVHAVDLPGLAFADEAEIDCSMSCQADRLSGLIERMGWNDLTVMGCSFGGAVAMLLAAGQTVGARIRALVLCAPVNPWSAFGQRRIRLLSTKLGGYFLRATLPISRPVHAIAVRRMYGDPENMPSDAVQGYRRSILRRGRAQNVLTALRNWQRDLDALRRAIPTITIPTLLVWGDRDGAVDPRSAAELQQRLRGAQFRVIRGAGHLPFEEKPDEFSRVVLEFLESWKVGNLESR